MTISNSERLACNNSSSECYGTAFIFECRVFPLRIAAKVLTFSSFLGPLAIGALVLNVGSTGEVLTGAVIFASIFSFLQIVVSLWALIAQWQNKLATYQEIMVDNYFLASEFKALASNDQLTDAEWIANAQALKQSNRFRTRADLREGITEEEKRMGMRYTLRYYTRPCSSCNLVPTSIESSNCPVCGNYKKRSWKWLT